MTRSPVRASSAGPGPGAAGLRLFRVGLLALGVCAALVSPGAQCAPAPLPLAEFDAGRLRDVAHANEALDAAAREREILGRRWNARERECYDRVLVNACLADLSAERRAAEKRIREIEIAARAVLRAADARRTSEQEAARADERARAQARDTERREASAQSREAHVREAQAQARQRAEDDAARAAQAGERERQQQERNAAHEARRQEAERRAAQASANSAAYAEKLRQHEARERERIRRQKERAEAAQRRQDAQPSPPASK